MPLVWRVNALGLPLLALPSPSRRVVLTLDFTASLASLSQLLCPLLGLPCLFSCLLHPHHLLHLLVLICELLLAGSPHPLTVLGDAKLIVVVKALSKPGVRPFSDVGVYSHGGRMGKRSTEGALRLYMTWKIFELQFWSHIVTH